MLLLKFLGKPIKKISIWGKTFFLNSTTMFGACFNKTLSILTLNLTSLKSQKVKIINDNTYYFIFNCFLLIVAPCFICDIAVSFC